MKKKYWIALADNPFFTRDDHYIFYVMYTGQSHGKGYPLTPKFVEADDLEEARSKLHAFVDEQINRAIHARDLPKKVEECKAEFKKEAADCSSITSLSIGDTKAKPKQSMPDELFNLFGDIGGNK